jgi:hypothetical protein
MISIAILIKKLCQEGFERVAIFAAPCKIAYKDEGEAIGQLKK